MSGDAARLILYHRFGCGLCDEMLERLRVLQQGLGFELDVLDVDEDEGLFDHYNDKVPLLTLESREICRYHLDEALLRKRLQEIRATACVE